jgi:uncharacterized protein YgiM (DUF1202 family)
MAKKGFGTILIYALPFVVGGVLIYSYIRRRKKLMEEKQSPQIEPTSTTATATSGNFNTEYFVVTSSGSLNVREKPSATSKIVGSLPKGNKVYGKPSGVTGWIELSKDGNTSFGFGSSQFLSIQKPSLSTGTFAPSTSGFENVGRPTGVSKPITPIADTTSGVLGVGRPSGSGFTKYKVVVSAGSNLNIRKSPSSTGTILEKSGRDTILLARPSSTSNWMEISKDGQTIFGYASKNYLSAI